jgi:hypothetical protein
MADYSQSREAPKHWTAEALSLAAQAKVLSGSKLEQLVVRLQRHTGRSKEACWRFVIQHGLKESIAHRRWSEDEIELVREELVKRSVEEVAKKLNRTPKSIRNMLHRNGLRVQEMRCDIFSLESLARALRVRKAEIHFWIRQGWLQVAICNHGKRFSYSITPEALAHAYKHHLADLLKRGTPNQLLFEAYVQYVHSPKHTVGEQLLEVRRDKRERAAFAALNDADAIEKSSSRKGDEDDECEDEYSLSVDAVAEPGETQTSAWD